RGAWLGARRHDHAPRGSAQPRLYPASGGSKPPFGVLSSPSGWARAGVPFLEGAPVEYRSLEESVALWAWKKRERIDLLKTIAIVTAQVNPDRASQALHRLIEEMFPE